jgi:hypothetical protein
VIKIDDRYCPKTNKFEAEKPLCGVIKIDDRYCPKTNRFEAEKPLICIIWAGRMPTPQEFYL